MRRLFAAAAMAMAMQGSPLQARVEVAPDEAVPASTVLKRSSTTITGKPLRLPAGALEVVISSTLIPPGGALPMHKHPWPRYAYVERGRLRVRYIAAGIERVFGPGEAVIEAINEWHEGQVVGSEPVRLIVIDHVPPGKTNIVRR